MFGGVQTLDMTPIRPNMAPITFVGPVPFRFLLRWSWSWCRFSGLEGHRRDGRGEVPGDGFRAADSGWKRHERSQPGERRKRVMASYGFLCSGIQTTLKTGLREVL